MARYRTISVREDVYEELTKLAAELGIPISRLIAELLSSYRRRGNELKKIEEGIEELREMLRECLSRLPAEGGSTARAGGAGEDSMPDFLRGNPWIDVIRVRKQQ